MRTTNPGELNVIAALIAAAIVAGQVVPANPAPDQLPAPKVFTAVPAAKKTSAKAAPKATAKGVAQSQSVVDRRKARKVVANKREAAKFVKEQIDNQREMVEYAKAVKAQEDYEYKMGPIWAAQNANAIQAQRNALIAQRNAIEKQKADYDAWILWQLRSQSR